MRRKSGAAPVTMRVPMWFAVIALVATGCTDDRQVSVGSPATGSVPAATISVPTGSGPTGSGPVEPTATASATTGGSHDAQGDTTVAVPGSAAIVHQNVNATLEIDTCRGDGRDGTVEVTGELTNLGDPIDHGSIDVELVAASGARVTVTAGVVSLGTGAHAQLDFGTAGADSPARSIGQVQSCWFDPVAGVQLFTEL